MATSSSTSSSNFPQLSAAQQQLLRAALTSNERQLNMEAFRNDNRSSNDSIFSNNFRRTPSLTQGIDPHVFDQPSFSDASSSRSPPSNWGQPPTFGNSFLPDFSNGHETDFDVDLPQGLLDGMPSFGNGEKRKSPEDEEDEDDDEQDPKRREGEEKVSKKPGRKPLTVEPTTKRKAQNRAAQRAFRERKEQHLKDLEQKIADLQKVSQTKNQENSLLRAQVMTLQSELHSYKKRLSFGAGVGSNLSSSPQNPNFSAHNGDSFGSNPFDFNFDSPSSLRASGSFSSPINADDPFAAVVKPEPTSRANSASGSPRIMSDGTAHNNVDNNGFSMNGESVLTPSFFNMSSSGYGFPQFGSPTQQPVDSSPVVANGHGSLASQARSLSGSIFSHAPSPSSSVSQVGQSSSCGTSPEPSNDAQSQGKTAYNSEPAKSPFGDLSDFQFDPSLFGGYRETQDAIFGDGDFTGGLYDDFLTMPETMFDFTNDKPATPEPAKPSLMDEVARRRDAGPEDDLHPPPPQEFEKRQMMTTNKIWQQLKECPKFQQGDLDIDGLCSELSKKATCSESGASIPKDEWEAALWRLVGQPEGAAKAAATTTKN